MAGSIDAFHDDEGKSSMTAIATLSMVNLDCADPRALAAFYHGVLGWDITYSEDAYAMVSDGTTNIGFGRVEGFSPAGWPREGTPKRYHLDLSVDDLDTAEAACLELGATRPDVQPGGDRWRVLLDVAGHPFCLSPRSS
jgi:predicted enzyme related to lactoylglutathione lyase